MQKSEKHKLPYTASHRYPLILNTTTSAENGTMSSIMSGLAPKTAEENVLFLRIILHI